MFFVHVVMLRIGRKCTLKCDAHAELFFCSLKLVFFDAVIVQASYFHCYTVGPMQNSLGIEFCQTNH